MNLTKNLSDRKCLGWWLNEAGLVGNGAEIGCAAGEFAESVLSAWKGKLYYMVDPWKPLSKEEYPEPHNQVNFEEWYQACLGIHAKDSRAVLMRMKSEQAAKEIPDGWLDFVYIDAAHDYRNVLCDMDSWFPKLKPGGLFGGHDFTDQSPAGTHYEVIPAVVRWMREHSRSFSVTPCTSWWMIK